MDIITSDNSLQNLILEWLGQHGATWKEQLASQENNICFSLHLYLFIYAYVHVYIGSQTF